MSHRNNISRNRSKTAYILTNKIRSHFDVSVEDHLVFLGKKKSVSKPNPQLKVKKKMVFLQEDAYNPMGYIEFHRIFASLAQLEEVKKKRGTAKHITSTTLPVELWLCFL